MLRPIVLGSLLACTLFGGALAGPCTQRIAELEKAVTAQHEGAGPALSPSASGSTPQSSSGQTAGVNVTADSQRANQAMQMLQQAKQLDQQGKEDECMRLTAQVSTKAPNTK